jgi:hypothetical protein
MVIRMLVPPRPIKSWSTCTRSSKSSAASEPRGARSQKNGQTANLNMRSNQMAMNLVPPEKLLVVKLEDGLGWEQICPFLGVDIPREPYPHANDPKEFEKMVHGFMTTAWTRSFKRWAALWTPVIGIGIWYVLRRKGF